MNDSGDFDETFDKYNTEKFPHKIGFVKEIAQKDNNYFNASIHCLTNIAPLSNIILEKEMTNYSYIRLLEKIQEQFNKKKDEIDAFAINNCLEKLKNYIFSKQYNKKINDPKALISFLLKDFQNNSFINKGDLYDFNIICKSCFKPNNKTPTGDVKIIEFDFPNIIKNNNMIKKNNITIYDCFNYYFKCSNSLNSFYCNKCYKTNESGGIVTIPKILIIFINYGNELICYRNSYEFDETISFKDFDFINYEDKNRKLFLNSMLACKNLGGYFETYYAFARANEKSKYYLYNGNEVKGNMKVTNKIKKKEIDLNNQKESWPFILVYIDENKNL